MELVTGSNLHEASEGRREEGVEKGGSVGLRHTEGGSNPSGGRRLVLQDGDLQVVTEMSSVPCAAAVVTHCFKHLAKGVSVSVAVAFPFAVLCKAAMAPTLCPHETPALSQS